MTSRQKALAWENLHSDNAQDALVLYKALVDVGTSAGADGNTAVSNAGYVVYAFLGGKARNINYSSAEKAEEACETKYSCLG